MADDKEDDILYTFTTPVFRGAFIDVFDGEVNIDEKSKEEYRKYSLTMLFQKGETLHEAKQKGLALMTSKFGANSALWPQGWLKPWSDQGSKSKDNPQALKKYDGYEIGNLCANASCYRKPQVFDQVGNEILDKNKVYSGCYMKANVTIKWFDNKSKGLKFQINALQFVKDGEKLGGSSVVFANVFTPVPMDTSQPAAAAFDSPGGAAIDPMS